MSLINEALKKAQRQRTDAAPPVAPVSMPAGGPSTPRIVKRRPPMPARTLMLLLIGGGMVLLTAGIVTFVLLNLEMFSGDDAPHPTVQRPPAAPAPAAIAPAVPTVTLPPVPKPVEVTPLPPVAPPVPSAPAPAPVTPRVVAPVPAVVLPPAPPVVPAAPVQPPAPAKPAPNPAVYAFLDTLRITGVRMAGPDSKVIMNDRIVRMNDYVNRSLGLRLTGVTASILVFTDDAGLEYTKSLQ